MTDSPARTDEVAGFPALIAEPPDRAPIRPPAVFLHGAFGDHVAFARWLERFADAGHLSVAAARRGRLGVGPKHAEGVTFGDYVDDTVAVLDEFEEKPVLVGHSLGGLLAQRLAEMGRARAIVLLAPAPPGMLTARPRALKRFGPKLPRIMTGRSFIVSGETFEMLALNRVPEAGRPAIHAHLTYESGKVYRAAMLGRVRVDATRVDVPVYVASGWDDHIISPSLADKTARHYGVGVQMYAGHGHWLLEEPGWKQIADDALGWLGSEV